MRRGRPGTASTPRVAVLTGLAERLIGRGRRVHLREPHSDGVHGTVILARRHGFVAVLPLAPTACGFTSRVVRVVHGVVPVLGGFVL